MQEFMENATKMMEKMWKPWQDLISNPPWMRQPDVSFLSKWSPWIATMRSTYDVNMTAWNTFTSQSEEHFFKMFKESPFHSESVERQMRDVWETLKKAQSTQQELVRDSLKKMEELLRAKEEEV